MKKSIQIKALVLLMLFLTQLFYPTVSLALTGGPSQPEVESFEPVSTDQMVDPFTGDFNYNLPLLTVPGPGGGYPINIAYHAGVSMDEEASWVGLGWNINPGVINRALRGIPDDFDGELISEKTSMRPYNSVSVFGQMGVATETEIFGAEFALGLAASMGATVSIDNYRGVGLETNFGMNYLLARNHNSTNQEENIEATEDCTKQTFTQITYAQRQAYSFGLNSSSRRATAHFTQGLSLSRHFSRAQRTTKIDDQGGTVIKNQNDKQSWDKGTFSISTLANTQPGNQVWSTSNSRVAGTFGITSAALSVENFNLGLVYSSSDLSTALPKRAYGYFYSEKSERGSGDLSDFFFDNDISFNKKTPRILTVVANQDHYLMSGQGLSGTFRAQKKGVGIFSENTIEALSSTTNINPEFEGGLGNQVGMTQESGNGLARVGSITGEASESLDRLQFGGSYFKLIGAFNGHNSNSTSISNDFQVDVPDPKIETTSIGIPVPRASFHSNVNTINNQNTNLLKKNTSHSTNIEFYTHKEKISSSISNNGNCIALENTETLIPITYLNNSNQIAEYRVRKTDGQIYVYGLAAMNTEQIERTFSLENDETTLASIHTSYETGDASTNNSKGDSHFFYEKNTPQYAHSYMITQILSSDYIDKTEDGPTTDDFGSYIKFSYTKFSDVRWRIPYYGANFSHGNLSDNSDDKASYIQGRKDIYFVKSIETKTHVAIFTISPRSDAHFAAEGELNSVNENAIGDANYKLDRIDLYQKDENGEASILIQSVEFTYDYSLCPGIPNFSPISNETSILPSGQQGGKLTLRKIQFSYGENKVVKETPYQFDYYQPSSSNHFNLKNVDRWNQPFIHSSSDDYTNQINPFSNPYLHEYSENERNEFVSLFNLKSITFPSGTKITVNYESDEYAYVQDKRAQTLLKLVGIGNIENTAMFKFNHPLASLSNNNRRLYFLLDSPISSIEEGQQAVAQSVENIDNIFFRLFLQLKSNPSGGYAEDYVNCFAEAAGSSGFISHPDSPNFGYGYIDIKKIESMGSGPLQIPQTMRNPLWYSGVDYIQKERQDLLNIVNWDGNQLGLNVSSILENIKSILGSIRGFMNTAAISGYCSRISTNLPSFIRLNDSDHRKFGGGHRVRSIETTNASTFSENGIAHENYITHYYYNLADGSSSGVAENEPSVGNEESALFQPQFYGSNKYLSLNREQYIQERAMLAFYPSPSIGYSRILTFRSIQSDGDIRSNEGVTEFLFHTAKEYPVKEQNQSTPKSTRISFSFPLVVVGGSIGFSNVAASQNFKVIINNMHGKPKEINTYSFPVDDTDFHAVLLANPSTRLLYEYYTDNKVNVLLDQFGSTQLRQIGTNVDGYLGERQRSTWDISGGGDFNLNSTIAAFVPSAYPQISYGEQYSRFLTSTTVITRNAILKSQTTISNGIQTKTENKLFDPNTGRVLVTETTVNGKDPITSFSIPAYWNYPILGAAGQNYRYTIKDGDAIHTDEGLVEIDLSISGGSVHCSADAYDFSEHYTEGDVVKLESNGSNGYYWVKNVTAGYLQLIDNENTPPANTTTVNKLMVMQSGFRNQQDFDSGSITISGKFEDLFVNSVLNLLNTELMSIPLSDFVSTSDIIIPVSTCSKLINFTFDPALADGSIKDFRISTDTPSETDGSEFSAVIDPSSSNLVGAYIQILRTIDGEFVLQVMDASGNPVANLTSSPFFLSALNFRSLDKVINASAIEFSEDIPLYSNNEFISTTSGNPYLNGTKGQWRPIRTYSYQGNRVYEQNNPTSAANGTNAHQDGLLFCFPSFVWSGANTQSFNESNNWLMSNEITIYNPNGLALEERNALGIYASQLVTNNENLVLCSNSNARMNEIGCLSFEESSSSSGNPGHINLLVPFASNTNYSHTGKKSHKIYAGTTDLLRLEGASSTTNSEFRALGTSKYQSHFWVKFDESISVPSFNFVDASGNLITQCEITNLGKPIDGWYLVSAILNVPSTGAILKVVSPGQTTLFDDFRIQPLNSSMVTYVYDYQNYRLLAQLDNQNYATFYNYSLDGSLIQIKQETASGVYTVSSMNQNIKR